MDRDWLHNFWTVPPTSIKIYWTWSYLYWDFRDRLCSLKEKCQLSNSQLHAFSFFRNYLLQRHCFSHLTQCSLKANEGSTHISSDFPDKDGNYVSLPPMISIHFVQTSRHPHNGYEKSQNVNVVLASKYTKNPVWVSCGCTTPPMSEFISCDGLLMESPAKYSPGDSALCSCFPSLSWYWSKWDHNADFPWKWSR